MKGTLRFLVPDQITCLLHIHGKGTSLMLLYGIILWALAGEDHISHPENPWFWIPASSIIPLHKVPNWWIKEINEIVTMYLQTAVTMKCEALLNKISLWNSAWMNRCSDFESYRTLFFLDCFCFSEIILKWVLK